MGCGESIDSVRQPDFSSKIEERAISRIKGVFKKEEFQEARNSMQMSEGLTLIRSIARDLTKKPPITTIPATLDKACFIICNTYTVPKYALGVGPMNDAITVAKCHKDCGYQVFFLNNTSDKEFLSYLPLIVKRTKKELTIYYTGYATNIKTNDQDEINAESMIFDNGSVSDNKFFNCIAENSNGKARILLIADCCHAGILWDMQLAQKNSISLPQNILSLYSTKISETAKKTAIGKKSHGIFTYFLSKILKENKQATVDQISTEINPQLKIYNEVLMHNETTPSLIDRPLFS